MRLDERSRKWLEKKAKLGFRGYPMGTLAFYGPDDRRASKVAVGIIAEADSEPVDLRRWSSETGDVRRDTEILGLAVGFLRDHDVRTVAMPDRILGCPHEEGADYPEGEDCPACPFWGGRDRWTGQRA